MINEFGLYKNVVPRWKIPGLKSNRSLDEQTQGWWLPFFDKEGNIHLVDTYHISSRCNFLDVFLKENEEKKDNSWIIDRSNYDYYYGGSVKMSSEKEKYFEMVCDLRDYEIQKIDPNDYKPNDTILNVQLYFEHAYPHGATMLRKGATKDKTREASNFMNHTLEGVGSLWVNDLRIEKLTKYMKDPSVDATVRNEIYIALKYLTEAAKAEKIRKEAWIKYNEEIKQLRGAEE